MGAFPPNHGPRVEHDGALDARPAAGAGRPQQHVVHDVGAGAVAREEEARHVAVLGDPLVLRRRRPLEPGPGVLVGRRERVLRRQAVAHGHHEDARRGREGVDVGVVRGGVG